MPAYNRCKVEKKSLKKSSKHDIPEKPGVYLFKKGESVLYIGKAKNLRKRVEQYFRDRTHGLVHNLLDRADDIEYIITDDETGALHLEYNLIHQYSPPFNIRLKDDKSFPLVEITSTEEFPGIYYTRQVKPGNFYLGPMVNARKTRELIDIVTRIFKLRTCSANTFNRRNACLYYYIDRCSAPCMDKTDTAAYQMDYQKNVKAAIEFLKGKKNAILADLEKQMTALADEMQFEEAQKIKEDIQFIHRFTLDSYISSVKKMDYDVICLHHDNSQNDCFIILFSVLEGRVKRKEFFNFDTMVPSREDILKDFLVSFYSTENIPREILVQSPPAVSDKNALEEMFSTLAGRKVTIKIPLKGDKRKTMDLAVKNLNLYVNKNKYRLVGERVQEALNLSRFPQWIEGFDISHLSERDRVGAAVVFVKGEPVKKKYRNYIIKKAAAGDTEAIKEVLERRFKNRKPGEQPDLLLIDGGKGQLSAALDVKERLGLEPDIVALAKREERIFMENGDSVVFPEDSPQRFLFQNIRDEVHRRAITHHRKRREQI